MRNFKVARVLLLGIQYLATTMIDITKALCEL